MFVYLSVFFIAVLFGFGIDYLRNRKIQWTLLAFLVLFLSLFGGFRDVGVGTDTAVYSYSYLNKGIWLKGISELVDYYQMGINVGYLLVNFVAGKISHEVWGAHFLVQLITNGFILVFAYKIGKCVNVKMWLFVLVYCCIFYNQTFNFMRQYCAVAILMGGFYYIYKQNWLAYVPFQIVAFFFHSSSLLFVLVPIFFYSCWVGYEKKWHYGVVIGAAMLLLVTTTYYYQALAFFNSMELISDTHFDRYGANADYAGRTGMRRSFIVLTLYNCYLVYMAYWRKIVDRRNVFFACTMLLSFLSFYALSFHSIFLYRLSLYFYLILMLYACMILCSKKSTVYEKAVFVLLILWDWYVYIPIHNGAESFPYRSMILGI